MRREGEAGTHGAVCVGGEERARPAHIGPHVKGVDGRAEHV